MGVIKKKTAVRGTEGGVKYICDVCSSDVTSTVRIRCAHDACKDYDLCVPCFSEGKASRDHDPPTHPFSVIEQHSVPIFDEEWGADEEQLLLEGAESYGLGSWADIADHIGGMRDKDEVRDHYIKTYVKSSQFPLAKHASPADRTITDQVPRDQFQSRKKRRIEEQKEKAKNAPPAPPKQKPTSSVPSCHEVQGFMPGRLEFETEYWNEAEEAVQHMQFEPGEGDINPRTGEEEPEMILKMTVMDIYNQRLTARVERKKFIFEHQLLEYKRNTAAEKKKTKEERDLLNRIKPFARLMSQDDFDAFSSDLEYELNLRMAISQLQEWRHMQISDLQAGAKYEHEKAQRIAKLQAGPAYDRFASSRSKLPAVPDEPPAVKHLTGPELSLPQASGSSDGATGSTKSDEKKGLTNGNANVNGGSATQMAHRPKFNCPVLPNITPAKLDEENAADRHLLSADEYQLVSNLRLSPKSYIAMKEAVLREAAKRGGGLKKKDIREICRIDTTKSGKLADYFYHVGWISKS